jgi:hemoglobin/transferrin/lactoferrin receptor protein
MALAAITEAHAQEAQLPGVNISGAKVKKSSAPKSKPKPQPTQAASSAPAPAEEPQPSSESAEAARIDAPYSTPAGVSVAGQSEIQTFGQGSVDNVFRSMPGVSTRESTNNPGIAVNIRGFEGSGRVNMTIDGVRQSFGFTGHEAQGFAYVDPLLLASIEVQRGAVSTTGGSGALAGAANMRTLDVDDILKPGSNYGSLSSITWGSNGVGFSEMASGAIRSGAISIVGAISKHDSNDFKNGDGQTVPYTGEDLISGLAKVHIQIDPTQRLSFGTVLYNNDFGANSYEQEVDSKIYTANYAYRPGNDLIDFRANFYGSDVKMHYYGGLDGFTSGIGRTVEDTGLGFDVSNISLFSLGGGVFVKSEYGYEYFHDDVDAFNTVTPTSGGGVNPSGTSSKGGVFSQTTFSKSIFDFIVGLRYDTFSESGSGVFGPGTGAAFGYPDGPFSINRTDDKFAPKLTLAAKPFDWFQPYVTYSESMRPPTVGELFTGGSHPGSGFGFLPNPLLAPEEQKGWEFGFNTKRDNIFQPGDALRFKADYFMMDVDNYVTACFAPAGVFFCNNPGTSRVQGVEMQGMYDAGFFFAGMSYTHTHSDLPSQIDGFGAHSYLPDDVATVSGGFRMMDQKLTVGARGYFSSKAYIGEINVNPGEPPYNDGYATVDLFSNYKFDNGVDLAFTITNLTDEAYSPALSTPASGFDGDTGRGRTFLLTTRAQF